ncbi:unnamed protein product, partial [Symbiodinium natans]
YDIEPADTISEPGRYILHLSKQKHFVGVRVFEDGSASLSRTHRPQDNLTVDPAKLRLEAVDIFCLVRTSGSTEVRGGPVSTSADVCGGKHMEMSALECIETMTRMDIVTANSVEIMQGTPDPIEITAPVPVRPALAFIQEDDSSADEGFWDARPDWYERALVAAQAREAEVLSDRTSDEMDEAGSSSDGLDRCGGSFPPEILNEIAQCFFSMQYSESLACVNRSFRSATQDSSMWRNKLLPLEANEFHSRAAVTAVSPMLRDARAFTIKVSQVPLFEDLPRNAFVSWKAVQSGLVVHLNGEGVCNFHSRSDTIRGVGAPALARLAVWVYFGRDVGTEELAILRPVPSAIHSEARLACAFCLTSGFVSQRRWAACPGCYTWICYEHKVESPTRMCSRCTLQLQDYCGGSSEASHRSRHFADANDFLRALQSGESDGNDTKSHLVIREVLNAHMACVRELPEAVSLLPDPREREVMSKRRWERLLHRARTILDLLEQHRHKLLYRFLHAESEKLGADHLDFVADLVDPDEVGAVASQWRQEVCGLAVRLLHELFAHERERARAQQDVAGGASSTVLEAGWPRPLPSMLQSVLEIEQPNDPCFYMSADPENESTDDLPGCQELAHRHAHPLDKRLHFKSDGHQYFFDGRVVSVSVTGFIHQFMEDFDADVAIEKMQFGWRWPREEYMKSEHSNPPLDLLGAKTLLEAVELDVARHLISFLEEVPLNKKAICSE